MARGTTKQAQAKQSQNKGKSAGSQSSGQTNRNLGASGQQPQSGTATSAIEMLKQDHRKVEGLFEQFEQAGDEQQKERLVEQICSELIVHTRLEEEIFYPACREAGVDDEKMDESQVEHDGAKMLINDLLGADSDMPYFEAKVSVLKEMIKHHVEEEEQPGEGVLAQAQEHGIDDADLAREMSQRKQELQQRGIGRRPARPVAIGMSGGMGERKSRYGGDERFRGENERGYGARSRYEEDQYEGGYDRGGRRGSGSEGDWNEGRYGGSREQMASGRRYEEDDRRLRSPYDDRDEDRRYGRGQGGWFGDPRGHSEASRRGSEDRRDEDDGRRRHRSRDDDDDRRRGGSHGGWFGDSRAHAEASRRGWQHRR